MPQYIAVLVTCPDKKSAQKLVEILLEEKLAACVNVLTGAESFYRWQGKIQHTREKLLLIKSQSRLFSRISRRVKQNHPYTVPEIIALPIAKGEKSYLDWIGQNTAKNSQ